MSTGASSASDTNLEKCAKNTSTSILWDRQNCIPLDKILSGDDVLLLLTPVVVPSDSETEDATDPFEPLGQALSKRHQSVRHVPYTKSQGITGVHVAFIKRAKAVIFVITGFTDTDGASQSVFADLVGEVCETRPLLIVACCGIGDGDLHGTDFATIIKAPGFSKKDLGEVASLLLEEVAKSPPLPSPTHLSSLSAAPIWTVQPWDLERDMAEAHTLWTKSLPPQFHLDRSTLAALLRRDGYAMHHVVREPASGDLVGFCATYTTFADRSGDRLVGSIAVILVRQDFRGRGIGRILYKEAFSKIHRIRGVSRIQLGSTFPRLLYGMPAQNSGSRWLKEQGWTLDESGPGKGRIVADWILRFSDLPAVNLASAGLSFRPCEMVDAQQVIDMISRESERKSAFGWYDQYAKVIDSSYMGEIILGFEGNTLVATAITYIPGSDSPTETDLPWAGSVGADIGGVTCICIKGKSTLEALSRCTDGFPDDDPEMVNRRDTVMVRMLHACCKSLSERDMAGVFIDGVKSSERGFESLGKPDRGRFHLFVC